MIMSYCLFFCVYSSVITHILLYHRYQVGPGFKGMWKSMKGAFSKKKEDEPEQRTELEEFADVHARLMRAYPEGQSSYALFFSFPKEQSYKYPYSCALYVGFVLTNPTVAEW